MSLVPDYDKRKVVIQPQTTRSRKPYRGTRSSSALTLDAEQLRFDLVKLRVLVDQFRTKFEAQMDSLDIGATPNTGGGQVYYPGAVNMVNLALSDILIRIAKYEDRLRILESR